MHIRSFILFGSLLLTLPAFPQAVATPVAATAATAVPALVPYSATVTDNNGQPLISEVNATFLLFKDESGGEPLWTESQRLTPDRNGRYTVNLGAASPSGIPLNVFASGEARWLEVQIAGQKPQPRVLLTSVPYAAKAADAATLGGLPASAFALAGANNTAATFGASSPEATASSVTTTGGSSNYIPVFNSPTTLINSEIFDTGKSVGIGDIPNPSARLDINGPIIMRGNMIVSRSGNSTTAKGYPSYGFDFFTSVWNSSTNAPENDYFSLESEPVGNNTATPSATFNLIYAKNGAAKETGFSINPNGTLNFAQGQRFPGSVTSVGLQMPSDFTITGSPLVDEGTILVQWANLPTSGNSSNNLVKRDSNGSFATTEIDLSNLVATSAATNTLTVYGTSYMGGANLAGPVGIGTNTPQTIFNINQNNTASNDLLLIGNNSTKGLQLRDNGTGVDMESIGVPLNVNYVTQQPVYINPNGGPLYLGDVNLGGAGLPASYLNEMVFVGPGSTSLASVGAPLVVGSYVANFINGEPEVRSAVFSNDINVLGNINGFGSKNFRIDHPLDPTNKYLVHASIESSEVLNQYSGNVVLDGKGEAQVSFPDWFAAINEDFRYQLTAIGAPGPNLYIAREVQGNSFIIAGGQPGMKVSWQVTARRNDAYMKAHPFKVERDKPEGERGHYTIPELYGQPREQSATVNLPRR